jgi:hypothetical protein
LHKKWNKAYWKLLKNYLKNQGLTRSEKEKKIKLEEKETMMEEAQ